MIKRRAVLQSGTALSVAALLPAPSRPAETAPSRIPLTTPLDRFVFDSRFSESLDAAREMAVNGIDVSGITGDLTSLWYDDLNLRWQRQTMTIAGLTAEDALFVLGTLAPGFGMRVIQQTEVGIRPVTGGSAGNVLPLYYWVIAARDRA